jgi:hypothetical protein
MHVVIVQINLFLVGMAVFAAAGPVSRLFAYPVPTSSIVGWHLLLGMVVVGLETLASIAVLNALFDLNWPLWGPALFAAVAMAAIQAVVWLTEKSGWIVVALILPGAGLCIWEKSRYGPAFSPPTHYWTQVTPAEVLILLVVAGLAYWVGVVGVARNRSGEPPFSIGLTAWLEHVLSVAPRGGAAFGTPAQAQLWFDWRKKGWAMPAMVVFGLVMAGGIWLLASRDPRALYEGLIAGGALTALAGFMGGFALGSVGHNDSDLQIAQFLATRPMTSTEMARIILKTMAKSVLLGWFLWAATFLALFVLLWALQVGFPLALPAPLGWWYFPATLLGAWTAAGILAAAVLTGRMGVVGSLFFGTAGLSLGLLLFARWALSPRAQEQFFQGILVACGVLLLVVTCWAFAAARRRELVGSPTLYAAFSVWVALSAVTVFGGVVRPAPELPVYALAVGLFALAVAPLATTPLALAWNRHR